MHKLIRFFLVISVCLLAAGTVVMLIPHDNLALPSAFLGGGFGGLFTSLYSYSREKRGKKKR
ncbi:MAG: hypothetical protein II904_05090 [Oscillospiraceae bacterium]|nr:hypothetical protein [Oscillospiraceae bacterium]